jgi:hypothetical protein
MHTLIGRLYFDLHDMVQIWSLGCSTDAIRCKTNIARCNNFGHPQHNVKVAAKHIAEPEFRLL